MKQQTEQSMKLRTLRCVATTMLLVGLIVTGRLARVSFPGKNGLIAFDTLDGGASQIYTIRPNGSDLRQLTGVSEGGTAFTPRWSADGRLIVYGSDQTGNLEIYIMNADGSGKRQWLEDTGTTASRCSLRTARRSRSVVMRVASTACCGR